MPLTFRVRLGVKSDQWQSFLLKTLSPTSRSLGPLPSGLSISCNVTQDQEGYKALEKITML